MTELKRAIQGNQGFTLVELIISFAILAIMSGMIALIIQSSANTYMTISNDINLQYESQTALSQIENYVVDCNTAVATNGSKDVLYIFKKIDDGNGNDVYEGYKFAVDTTTKKLKLYAPLPVASFDAANLSNFSFNSSQTMSDYVISFTANLAPDTKSIEIIIGYQLGSRSYTGRQTIAFRNAPVPISSSVTLP
jgi:prepilin-type N-terminal cleavage/methylation domain-containing protein